MEWHLTQEESVAVLLGLLFSKVTVIWSRDTVQSNWLLVRKFLQCQDHKSPSPRRALNSCSTWGPLTPFAACRSGSAGAALLQCLWAAAPTLLGLGPSRAIYHLVSRSDVGIMADPLEKPYWIFCPDPEPVPEAAGSSLTLLILGRIMVLNC